MTINNKMILTQLTRLILKRRNRNPQKCLTKFKNAKVSKNSMLDIK